MHHFHKNNNPRELSLGAKSRSWLKTLAKQRGTWLAIALAAGALLPTLTLVVTAAAEGRRTETVWEARQRVLRSMAQNPSILINVTAREMPGSPDILNLGKRSTRALERCLSDNANAYIRRTCANLLGALGDRRALPTLQAALEDWDSSVRFEVIQALKRIPDDSSFKPLMKLYQRKDETDYGTLSGILATLGALGNQKAIQVLRKELRKKEWEKRPDLRSEAFRGLWMSRHLMARATLTGDVAHALKTDNSALILEGTVSAAELRSKRLVRPLIPLLDHGSSEIRNKAVYALGRIGDRAAARALLNKLPKVREARMLNNIAFALERLDSKSFYTAIQKLISHKQAIIRLNAAFVIGDVRKPEGLPLLKKAISDPSEYVKTSAIVALGKLGTKDAIEILEPLIADGNSSIRQEAIYAINELSGGQRQDLIYEKLFKGHRDFAHQVRSSRLFLRSGVRRRAALELAKRGDQRVRDYLIACYESSSCSISDIKGYLKQDSDPSISRRLLLLWARGRTELTEILGKRRPSGTRSIAASGFDSAMASGNIWVAKRSADLIGDVGDKQLGQRLRSSLRSQDTWLRLHTSVALARLGDREAERVILGDLDRLPAEWLPRFSRSLNRIDQKEVRARLKPGLEKRAKSKDTDLALAAASILLQWNPEKSFFRFLDALAAPSVRERELAEYYLRKNRSKKLTWVMRRALARENRPYTRDRIRNLLDARS